MVITDSKLWISDLDDVIGALPELYDLRGKSVMITGCTGLICSALADLLARFNEVSNDKIRIIAAGRSREKIQNRFSRFTENEWFSAREYDVLSPDQEMREQVDYVIHGAGNASPGNIVSEPVETIWGSVLGIKNLLENARQGQIERILYISSSEVYGKNNGDKPLRVDDYGFIDPLAFRNAYSIGKKAAETLCVSYEEEYRVDSVIARPGHVYGPTASKTDNRVASAWAFLTAEGKDIVMKSDGAQVRSYCYVLDCASALIKILLKGKGGRAYNISNPSSIISIRKLAELYSEAAGVKLLYEAPNDMEKKGFNPMLNSSLDASDLLELGWKGLFDAKTGIDHTIRIIKQAFKE